MKEPAYFEAYHEQASMVIGFCFGIFAGTLIGLYIASPTNQPELSCREGKLYEVSHEGNITIYNPTFDECEVAQ